MADLTVKPILSVCATTSARLSELLIKDGQLIFVQDRQRIAFDFNGKRVFYNRITEIETEQERAEMANPLNSHYYFVIDTAVLWTYQDKWIQLTTPPKEILFIGTNLPELGSNKTLYVDTSAKEISVWDDSTSSYVIVAEKTKELSADEIDAIFGW